MTVGTFSSIKHNLVQRPRLRRKQCEAASLVMACTSYVEVFKLDNNLH